MKKIVLVVCMWLLLMPSLVFAQSVAESAEETVVETDTASSSATMQVVARSSEEGDAVNQPAGRKTATIIDFIENDPLEGDNGMETSPVAPLIYGPVNIMFDTDGNSIEAVDEQEIDYFEGYYYLYGASFYEGAFNYAPGSNREETIPSGIPSFYRWSGLTIYRSKDLENWEFVSRWYPMDEGSGKHIIVQKPRVVYNEKTGKYVMWYLNKGPNPGDDPVKVVTSDTPVGPWSEPQSPTILEGMTQSDLSHDFQIQVDPDTGYAWLVQAADGIHLYKLNEEMTGIAEDHTFTMVYDEENIMGSAISGGIGLATHNDKWYILGTPLCGNCVRPTYKYFMADEPEGPWYSPDTMSSEQPLTPAVLSYGVGNAQPHGVTMLPDGNGDTFVLVWATHYRSSDTGAPQTENAYNVSGDNSLALSGQFWFPLEFEEDGHIKPIEIKPSYEVPLAEEVFTEHMKAYQADLSIIGKSYTDWMKVVGQANPENIVSRSARQEWTVEPGTEIACISPVVFQFTPDYSPATNKWITQDPLVNAPLIATLELPNGVEYSWTIDARTIKFGPMPVPLNLPEVYTEGGRLVLTLSTSASNGAYGIVLGEAPEWMGDAVYSHVNKDGNDDYPGYSLKLEISDEPASAPVATVQPVDVTVKEGTKVGFLFQAEGEGVGYQWYHDGDIVMPHGVTTGTRNEAVSAALRLSPVTKEDAGEYYAYAFNTVGKIRSNTVTLTVLEE